MVWLGGEAGPVSKLSRPQPKERGRLSPGVVRGGSGLRTQQPQSAQGHLDALQDMDASGPGVGGEEGCSGRALSSGSGRAQSGARVTGYVRRRACADPHRAPYRRLFPQMSVGRPLGQHLTHFQDHKKKRLY